MTVLRILRESWRDLLWGVIFFVVSVVFVWRVTGCPRGSRFPVGAVAPAAARDAPRLAWLRAEWLAWRAALPPRAT